MVPGPRDVAGAVAAAAADLEKVLERVRSGGGGCRDGASEKARERARDSDAAAAEIRDAEAA